MDSAQPPEGAKPIVFAPVQTDMHENGTEPALKVRQGPDGTRGAPVFSSAERLAQALGRQQPWVALPLQELLARTGPQGEAGIDRLALDPADPPDKRPGDGAEDSPAPDAGIPELIAVPARPGAPGSGELVLEARQQPGHGVVLPVFSTVGKLVEALGPYQPWVLLPMRQARAMAAAAGVEHVQLDPVIGGQAPRWDPEDLRAFGREG